MTFQTFRIVALAACCLSYALLAAPDEKPHVYQSFDYEAARAITSISIDGRTKRVEDYAGAGEGMPAVISDLEKEVDKFARTERWIKASDGLVTSLCDEKFRFSHV
jgi:hypothetical protein